MKKKKKRRRRRRRKTRAAGVWRQIGWLVTMEASQESQMFLLVVLLLHITARQIPPATMTRLSLQRPKRCGLDSLKGIVDRS
ncbi:hypothetical protein E2C01_085982 [Portunus trituberculatus]|uniref:Uncharacterized protein n=1 Tax=Portunus trituberculatus TaxID=210409 RepID=A0A5B7JF42_PORTR|nr:hypothetical protein [Portunus trituberculatus]